MDRIAALRDILAANPNDAFARYALALEHSKAGEVDAAVAEFKDLVTRHPDYTNGYFMAAQALSQAERNDEACALLREGIASAQRTGNQHARNEMEQMLDEIAR